METLLNVAMVRHALLVAIFASCIVSWCTGLRCYCNDDPECKNSNNTCYTEGVCYASITRVEHGGHTRSYRCLPRDQLILPDIGLVCKNSNVGELFAFECCQIYDYCNLELTPSLMPITQVDEKESIRVCFARVDSTVRNMEVDNPVYGGNISVGENGAFRDNRHHYKCYKTVKVVCGTCNMA